MTDSLKDRALRLIEQEDRRAEELAERERKGAEESRIRDAQLRIRRQDQEIAAEQARREAQAEADRTAAERYALAGELEEAAAKMNRKLAEYQALHKRHADALRRAGHPLGHGAGLQGLITRWWRVRFGGWNSITSTPGPHHNAEDKPLAEMDHLARAG